MSSRGRYVRRYSEDLLIFVVAATQNDIADDDYFFCNNFGAMKPSFRELVRYVQIDDAA